MIRGPNVMTEYESNPSANAEAFYGDWFRTGDQGVMDEEGYLTITGRLKEIINRGGEKISPREVDEILMEHPAVHQCVCFAMPHQMLGEDVAAAIVLRQGAGDRPGPSPVCRRTAGRFQSAPQDPYPERNSRRAYRQASAHRAGRETRTRMTHRPPAPRSPCPPAHGPRAQQPGSAGARGHDRQPGRPPGSLFRRAHGPDDGGASQRLPHRQSPYDPDLGHRLRRASRRSC